MWLKDVRWLYRTVRDRVLDDVVDLERRAVMARVDNLTRFKVGQMGKRWEAGGRGNVVLSSVAFCGRWWVEIGREKERNEEWMEGEAPSERACVWLRQGSDPVGTATSLI